MFPLRDTEPSFSKPVVTIGIIVANLLVFFYEISLDPYTLNHLIAQYGVVPERFHVSSIFTSMFLHGGWMHVLGNMWFLWIYGDNVEDVMGHGRYLLFYLLCGAAAAMTHIVFNLDSRLPTVGASGAIAGVMGAYLIKFPRARIITLVPVFIFLTTFEIPAAFILVYWFLLQTVSGFGCIGYSHLSQQGVAWFAHVGGFVSGMILVNLMGRRERYWKRRDLRW